MAIRAVVWDFDGTLASSLEGIAAAMQETLQAFGYAAPTTEQVRATVGLTLEESMRWLTRGESSEDQIPQLVAKYRSLHASLAAPLTTLFPGARAVLGILKERGVLSVVVSNKGRIGLKQLIDQLEIGAEIAIALSADDVLYRKPDGRLYTQHIAPLLHGLLSDEVLVVGDTESDLRFALDAGLKVCWAKYGYGDPEVCQALQPTHTIESIGQVVAVIEWYA
jgi:phosphoglycolate phosphatase